MGTIIGIFSILFAILIPIGLIVLIVFLFKKAKADGDKATSIGIKTLLKAYTYILSFLSLIVLVGSLSVVINSALSYKFGKQFSFDLSYNSIYINENGEQVYQYDTIADEKNTESVSESISNLEAVCITGEEIEIDGQKACFDTELPKKEIIYGSAIAIAMLVLFILHRLGAYKLDRKKNSMLKRAYYFISLITFGISGLITIPVSIYQIIGYVYFRPTDITEIAEPGLVLSITLLVIPIWIYFLVKTTRIIDNKEK